MNINHFELPCRHSHTWSSCHPILLCIHDINSMHMHAIGVPEGVTLVEFEGTCPNERGASSSTGGLATISREHQGGSAWVSESWTFSLCKRQAPEHSKPPTLRKQWVYICYICIVALSYRSWLETLTALICPLLVQYTCLESYSSLGSNSCLAMLYTGRSRVIPYHLWDIGSIGSRLAIFFYHGKELFD
jgi:hypothetical protein